MSDETENGRNDTAVEADAEQHGGGEAAEDRGSSAVKDEDAPSLNLREAWPQLEMDGGKGLVICTVDVQLLTGELQFFLWQAYERRHMHAKLAVGYTSRLCTLVGGLDDC